MKGLDVSQKSEVGNSVLKKLTPQQIGEIDEYLASVGEYGEIHLIIQHGVCKIYKHCGKPQSLDHR